MGNNITMKAADTIAASLAECYVTIDGRRYNLMQAISVEATFKKSKKKVPILGKTAKGNKSTGWEGTGKAKLHYNTTVFRQMMADYKDTGEDIYFDMQISNEDPTSKVGRQTVILYGCNIDGGILTKFDADADNLEEDIDFTFEDFKIPESFKLLEGFLTN